MLKFFCTAPAECANCRRRVRPNGRLLFLHRLTGALELPQAGSPLTGGVFFAEIQRWGFAVCGRRDVAAPAAGAKRKDNLRFSFLFGLLPFPCFLIWRRLPTCDRSEIRGTAEDFFYRRGAQCAPLSRHIRSVRYITATHAVYSTQARHTRVAQIVFTLFRPAPTGFN